MPQLFAASPHRLRRLAWFGALVLVLRFAGVELHEVAATHEPGENCAYCLVLERGGSALAPTAAVLVTSPPPAFAAAAPAPTVRAVIPPAPLPRGPPLLSA
jgi:hypothetical protein